MSTSLEEDLEPSPEQIKEVKEQAEQVLRQHDPPLEVDKRFSGLFDKTTTKALKEHSGNVQEAVKDISGHMIDDYNNAQREHRTLFYLHPFYLHTAS